MKTTLPADRAKPGAIRRYRKLASRALADYRAARRAFISMDRSKGHGRYGVLMSHGAELAAASAFAARDEWTASVRRLQDAELIRDEMVSGERDRLGRLRKTEAA